MRPNQCIIGVRRDPTTLRLRSWRRVNPITCQRVGTTATHVRKRSGLALLFGVLFLVCDSNSAVAADLGGRKGAVTSEIVAYRSDGRLPTVSDQTLEAEFTAFSRKFQLRLLPSPVVDPDFTESYVTDDSGRHRVPTYNHSYVGTLVDEPGSSVRLTLIGRAMKGVVRTGSDLFFVEPMSAVDPKARNRQIIVYRGSENPPPELPADDVVASHDIAPRNDARSDVEELATMAAAASTGSQANYDLGAEGRIVYDNTSQPPTGGIRAAHRHGSSC